MKSGLYGKFFILFFLKGSIICIAQNNMGILKDTVSGHQKIQVLQLDKNSIKRYPFSIEDTSILKIDTLKEIFKGDTIEEYHYYSKGEMIKNIRYKNGKLNRVCEYKNVQLHGMWREFHDNGKLANFITYSNGEIINWIAFYNNGMLKHFRIDDTLAKTSITKHYYENGNIREEYFTDLTTLKQHETRYHEDGTLNYDDYSNEGKRKRTSYFSNGKIMEEYWYFDMTLFFVGELKFFYENGKLKHQAFYKDGNSREEANYRTGKWSWWDEKGNLIKQEIYKNNELVEKKEFLPEVKGKEK